MNHIFSHTSYGTPQFLPKWTSIDPLHRHWKKNPLAHYEVAYSMRSGQWIVDSGQWLEMGNGGKQT